MCGKTTNSYEIYKSRRWDDCTFARASPVSLSRKPLSFEIEATPKTYLSLSGSLVHRQTWRLTGFIGVHCMFLCSCFTRIGSAATATGSFLLGTAGVHQIMMKVSQHHRKMHQN